MRVRIAYTVDVDDDFRRAIRNHYGQSGLADREDVRQWVRAYGDSMNDDIIHDLGRAEGDAEARADDEWIKLRQGGR